jgi:hypothetical protein
MLGAWNLENIMSGLEGFTLAPFTRIYGWTPEEVELFLIDLRKEKMRNTNIHAYWNMCVSEGCGVLMLILT